jgi:hypothetical protein
LKRSPQKFYASFTSGIVNRWPSLAEYLGRRKEIKERKKELKVILPFITRIMDERLYNVAIVKYFDLFDNISYVKVINVIDDWLFVRIVDDLDTGFVFRCNICDEFVRGVFVKKEKKVDKKKKVSSHGTYFNGTHYDNGPVCFECFSKNYFNVLKKFYLVSISKLL